MKTGVITEKLLRDLLTEVEELAERYAEDRVECWKWGSEDGELRALKNLRVTRSIIRQGRKALLAMIEGAP